MGLYPRLGGAGHLRPVHAEAGLGCKPRGRHAQLAGRSAGAAPLRRHRPGYQDPPLDRLSLRCAGPSGPAERGVRSAGPRDREAGGRLPRRGPRPCEAQGSVAPRRRRAATDSIPTGRNRSSSSCTSSATTGDRLRRGPRSSTARSGDRRRSSPCCCRTRGRSASTPLTRCSSSPTARPGSGDASSASSPRSGSRRHRCWG